MDFELIGAIDDAKTMASGRDLRELRRLRKAYGGVNWRKCKGRAEVSSRAGETVHAEVHWYEAHGIGRVELKLKRYL